MSKVLPLIVTDVTSVWQQQKTEDQGGGGHSVENNSLLSELYNKNARILGLIQRQVPVLLSGKDQRLTLAIQIYFIFLQYIFFQTLGNPIRVSS